MIWIAFSRFMVGVAFAGFLCCRMAWAQGAYGDLVAQSAALSESQRAQARQLFATGFELWQGGDCAASVLSFGQGLRIDPANPQANFYQGDCLQKLGRRDEAAEALRRTMALGAGTSESFKAQAALEALSKPVPFSEMTMQERKKLYVGNWVLEGWGDSEMSISLGQDGSLQMVGTPKVATCPWCRFDKLEYVESDGSIRFIQDAGIWANSHFRLRLVNPNHMTGEVSGGSVRGQRLGATRK